MPFLKNIQVDDIQDVTVMINKDLIIAHGFKPDNRIHIAISDFDKCKQDVLVELSNNDIISNSTSMSHIDFIIDTDLERLEHLIKSLLKIRSSAKLHFENNNG